MGSKEPLSGSKKIILGQEILENVWVLQLKKKNPTVQGLLGPPVAPLACGAPRKILGCHPLSTALSIMEV